MHNLESVQDNKTHKILWDFDIQTDHLISARRPDVVIVNKEIRASRIVDFVDPRVELKKKDKYLDFSREVKKTMEHESDNDTKCNWCVR